MAKQHRHGESTGAGDEGTQPPEILVEGESMEEDESSSCPPTRREHEPMEDVDERAPGTADRIRQFSPGASAKFAFRAACYLAGRAADRLVSVYTRAVTLDRDYIADFNKSAGLAHARNKRWDKAIPLLEKSLTVTPDDVETRMRLAEACAAEHEYEKACRHLEKILETTPHSAAAVRALGAICVRQQDYDRAIEYLEKAVRLDPDHAQAHYRLGIAYDNKKRYEQAVDAFKKSIRLDPRFAKAYHALGFAYETLGNRELAVECFKKALELE